MRIMKFAIRRDHLFFVSLLCGTVLVDNGRPVFSIRVASPENRDVNHVRFGNEDFVRFYRCLLTFKTCSVTYTERYSQTQGNNVLLVRGNHALPFPTEEQPHSPVTWFCTRTRTGELNCKHKYHPDGYRRFGVRPLWMCDAQLCPCIYFYNTGQISYDSSTAEECSRKSLEITNSKRIHGRRASGSSSIRRRRASRSSKSSSRSKSRSRTSSSISRTITSYSSSSSSSNSSSSAAVDPATIAGITVGAIVFVGFTICIICYCVNKQSDEMKGKRDNAMAESSNDVAEEKTADNWNNGSDFPLPDTTYDTGALKHNGEDGCAHSLSCDDGNKEKANNDDVNEIERQTAKENQEHWYNRELERHNQLPGYSPG